MTRLTWIVFALNLFACASPTNNPGDSCGNGVCDSDETVSSCEEDCARPDAGGHEVPCGDHICQSSETPQSCPQDCGMPVTCGDNVCASSETVTGCPSDCAAKLLVDNLSTYTIEYLYAWSCSATNTHTDILGAHVLLPNYHIEFDDFPPGCWDFQAVTTTNLTANQNNVQLQARVLQTLNFN